MIFPQEKPLDKYFSFLTKILETPTRIPAKNFLPESQNIHTRIDFFRKSIFSPKKIFSTTSVQVWQPWRKISTEWPQVLLSESKTFCKIKRSFRDFFTRKCSTGSVECSLNNPVAGFPARRPKLFGSDSHIHFKKQISERKFLPKSSTGHQNLKCSQAWKIYITKTDKKNCWTSFTKKKLFHRKHFSSSSRMENDKPAAEKTRQVSKNVPASVSKKLFDWSFLRTKHFSPKLPLV